MTLKNTLKQHLVIAAAAMSLGAGAMGTSTSTSSAPEDAPIVQKEEKTSVLDDIQNNRKITYNDLSFDTPLLREKQKTNPVLAGFNFHFQDNETGFSMKDGDKTFLALMPREKLDSLIRLLIAKDSGKPVDSEKALETVLPSNPNEWKFQSSFPEILVVENNERRPIKESELSAFFDKAKETLQACNSEDIIDIKKIAQTYGERIGGATGKGIAALFAPCFTKGLQNGLISTVVAPFKETILASLKDLPRLRAEEKAAFDQKKEAKVLAYQEKMEQEKLIAQKEAEQETARKASLINFNHISDVNIVQNQNQRILLFSHNNHTVELNAMQTMFATVTTYNDKGEQTAMRELEPEEWQQLSKDLSRMLTSDQKQQLGKLFFQKLTQKAHPQLLAQLTPRNAQR